MDIKIGLLVQNRISVQDVLNHQKTLTIDHHAQENQEEGARSQGAEQEACPVQSVRDSQVAQSIEERVL